MISNIICGMKLNRTTHILKKKLQNSSLNAAGFFSQNMKIYLVMMLRFWKYRYWVVSRYWRKKLKLQTTFATGPKIYLFRKSENKLLLKYMLLLFLKNYSEENYHIVQDYKIAGYYKILSYYY